MEYPSFLHIKQNPIRQTKAKVKMERFQIYLHSFKSFFVYLLVFVTVLFVQSVSATPRLKPIPAPEQTVCSASTVLVELYWDSTQQSLKQELNDLYFSTWTISFPIMWKFLKQRRGVQNCPGTVQKTNRLQTPRGYKESAVSRL